jgi:uncharacterized RDD family membrane protein YckC
LLAFAADLGILAVPMAIVLLLIQDVFPASSIILSIPFILFIYFSYHAAVLTNQNFAFGRVIARISVISIRGNDLTLMQAVIRAGSRCLLFACGISGAAATNIWWIILLPLGIEVSLISATSWRRSIADVLAGTLVIRSPQVQPHRAPAAPMYSSTDSEFGIPPKW